MKTLIAAVSVLLLITNCNKETIYQPIRLCEFPTQNIDSIRNWIGGIWFFAEEKLFNYETNEYYYNTEFQPGKKLIYSFKGDTVRFLINGRADSIYRFKIVKEHEISGYADDKMTVIAYYSLHTGQMRSYV